MLQSLDISGGAKKDISGTLSLNKLAKKKYIITTKNIIIDLRNHKGGIEKREKERKKENDNQQKKKHDCEFSKYVSMLFYDK